MSDRNGSPPHATKTVVGNAADVTRDIVTLAELQLQLLYADSHECLHKMKVPAGLAVVALATITASICMALTAIVSGLVQAGYPTWLAYLSTAGVGMVLSAVLVSVAWVGWRNAMAVLKRSHEEFQSNVDWLKRVLTRGNTQSRQ